MSSTKTGAPSAKRIALVASIAWTIWNYRRTLIEALVAAGYEVVVIAAEDQSQHDLQKMEGVQFLGLKQVRRSSLSLFTNFKLLLEFYRVFRKSRPDLILLFTIRPNTLGNLAANLLGIPTLSTLEGLGSAGAGHPIFRGLVYALYRFSFKFSQKVLFLNSDDLQKLAGGKSRKAVLMPGPGVDTDHFRPIPAGARTGTIVFLFMGRLLSDKGIREFAAAAKSLTAAGQNAAFWVLGNTDSGNPTSIDEQEIREWAAAGFIQYKGFIEDVRPVLAQADVLVLPSRYGEGIPRAILEAMAMGKMIITTDHVGCRDTVVDGLNGFLIQVKNAQSLEAAMLKTLFLPNGRIAEMGRKGRHMAETRFSDRIVIAQYLSIIESLLHKVQIRS